MVIIGDNLKCKRGRLERSVPQLINKLYTTYFSIFLILNKPVYNKKHPSGVFFVVFGLLLSLPAHDSSWLSSVDDKLVRILLW